MTNPLAKGIPITERYVYSRPDYGHTKVCSCGKPHGLRRELIGKERDVEIEKCAECRAGPKKAPYGG